MSTITMAPIHDASVVYHSQLADVKKKDDQIWITHVVILYGTAILVGHMELLVWRNQKDLRQRAIAE